MGPESFLFLFHPFSIPFPRQLLNNVYRIPRQLKNTYGGTRILCGDSNWVVSHQCWFYH